jgi:hypothetical protein
MITKKTASTVTATPRPIVTEANEVGFTKLKLWPSGGAPAGIAQGSTPASPSPEAIFDYDHDNSKVARRWNAVKLITFLVKAIVREGR